MAEFFVCFVCRWSWRRVWIDYRPQKKLSGCCYNARLGFMRDFCSVLFHAQNVCVLLFFVCFNIIKTWALMEPLAICTVQDFHSRKTHEISPWRLHCDFSVTVRTVTELSARAIKSMHLALTCSKTTLLIRPRFFAVTYRIGGNNVFTYMKD